MVTETLKTLEEKGLIVCHNELEHKHWRKPRKFYLKTEYYLKVTSEGFLEADNADMADDWVLVFPEGYVGDKYSVLMFSPSLQRARHTTMMEFYSGSSIVD